MNAGPPSGAGVLNWDDLRIVLTIAEHGTLSAAAAHLLISHPTLSRRLQQLERRLGTRLVKRSPLRLTAAGEEVRELAQSMRERVTILERSIAGRDTQQAGLVRLTAPDAVAEYLLPDILATLCRELQGLTIELVVTNQVVSLAQGVVDIALRVTANPTDTLRGRPVGTVNMAVYAAQGCAPDSAAAPFFDTDWVGFDAALACSGPGSWISQHVPERNIRFRANTLLGAAQAIRSGIGIGLLPCFVGGSLPGLTRISEPLPSLAVPLWLLFHPETAELTRVRRTCEALASQLKDKAPLLAGTV